MWLLRSMVPGLSIEVDKTIFDLRSCVVVANHRSYLDPVILAAVFEKHCTIVKSSFFRVPVFGRIINAAGYIPSYGENDKLAALLHQRVLEMNMYLSGGGVLFVFPEGTRSRDGRIGPFHTGAFKIAQRTGAPLEVICITNTGKVFAPGRFLLHTDFGGKIEIRRIGRIPPDDDSRAHISEFMAKTREMMENHLEGRQHKNKRTPGEP